VLGGLDLRGDGFADFITAKLLLEMSNKLKFVEEGNEEFFTALIKNHRCWDNLNFWEKYFRELVPVAFVTAYGDGEGGTYSSEAINWLTKKIVAFAHSMAGWGHLTADQIVACTLGATETLATQELNFGPEKDELITKVQHSLARQPPVIRSAKKLPETPRSIKREEPAPIARNHSRKGTMTKK